MKKEILLLLLVLLPGLALAQFLENPSFEGPVGIGLTPPDWLPFNPMATPDTEPLDCDDFPASDGSSYITLVGNGTSSSLAGVEENCQASLLNSMEAGVCYSITMDMASRDDLGHYEWGTGFIHYPEGVRLSIYGSSNNADKGELLAESEIITNINWQNYAFTCKPLNEVNYLVLEVSLQEGASENGNLLIDNLAISEDLESRVLLNDTFQIKNLPITITASEGSSYSWSPGSGLSCYDCRSPQVNSTTSRTYTCRILELSDGCPVDELFILTFNDIDPPVQPEDFKIPNVFTPNGDNLNDLFHIMGLPLYSALRIYDRSGKELYSNENYDNSWDGTDMEGNELEEGNYYYVLITPGLGSQFKGMIYLKRK